MEIKRPNPPLQFSRALQRRARTDAIILHHYHNTWMTPHDVHRLHLGMGWPGIGYNVVVDLAGPIWEGRGLHMVGTHTAGYNATTLGIGCQGRFHDHTTVMPDAQFESVVWLIRECRKIFGDIPILGHRDKNRTACPGKFFPLEQISAAANAPLIYMEDEEVTQEQFNKMLSVALRERSVNADENHWAQQYRQQLEDAGVTINEARFNDLITRGETMAIAGRVLEASAKNR